MARVPPLNVVQLAPIVLLGTAVIGAMAWFAARDGDYWFLPEDVEVYAGRQAFKTYVEVLGEIVKATQQT